MEEEIEIWKDVIGFEDSYEISNFGNLKSKDRFVDSGYGSFRMSRGTLRVKSFDKDGYYKTALYKNQVAKHYRYHQLVAIHFIPNPENKPQVNHKDGVKTNNHVDNLEWCNNLENRRHAFATGLQKNNHVKGEKCIFSKLKKTDVDYIRANYIKKVTKYKQFSEMFNVSEGLIGQIIKNKIWQ